MPPQPETELTKWDNTGMKKVLRGLDEVANTKEVSFADLFAPSFMVEFTDSATFEQFVTSGGWEASAEAFQAIPDADFDTHIRLHSQFGSWSEMQTRAGELWMRRKVEGI
jgi:hypothetical protein